MDIIILILATWRISSLLVDESGPFQMFEALRCWMGIRYNEYGISYSTMEWTGMFTCLWCMSVWIGVIVTILYATIPLYTTIMLMPFALSTGAIIVKGFLDWQQSNH